jgi:hypothetical protein
VCRWDGHYIARNCDVYISTGVVRVVKCRRLGWAGHVAKLDVTHRGTVLYVQVSWCG